MSENCIIFTHVDEARKANLHAYKRITIRRAIYERGLCNLTKYLILYCGVELKTRSLYVNNARRYKYVPSTLKTRALYVKNAFLHVKNTLHLR